MDWQIRPLARKSSLSGKSFTPGDRVVCAIFMDDAGNLDRVDILKDELEAFKLDKKILGKWEREVSANPEADERAARRMALAGSEDFFLSLFDESSQIDADEKDVIKQMLALLLERKRIIRPVGRPSGGIQKYVHCSTKRILEVPQNELDESLVMNIKSQLDYLIM